jgi:hypothetical protein
MNRAAEYDLAWDLMSFLASVLTGEQRCAVCTEIGAGQPDDAIRGLFVTALQHLKELPADLMTRVTAWLDCYIGSDHEPSLREILTRLTASA